MKVEEMTAQLGRLDGKSSDEIKNNLARVQRVPDFLVSPEQKEAARMAQQMVAQNFNGDARAAVDFMKQHGNDPAVAKQDFAQFVKSGQASQYVQSVNGQAVAAPSQSTAAAQSPVAAATITANNPSQQAGMAQPLQMAMSQMANPFGAPGQGLRVGFDRQGRLDLNGDGVGGLPGLMKSLLEGGITMAMGNMARSGVQASPLTQIIDPQSGMQIASRVASASLNATLDPLKPGLPSVFKII